MINVSQNKQSASLTTALIAVIIVPQLGLGISTPANSRIAEDLNVSVTTVQDTIILYMVGYALSMLFAGLLSDRLGARKVQLLGIVLSCVATFGAALAPNVVVFAAARFLQAFGGCVATVTTRLIVRDEYAEKDHMKVLTTLASVFALGPCIMPFIGGYLINYISWRVLFVMMGFIMVVISVIFSFSTKELKRNKYLQINLSNVLRVYYSCFKDNIFRLYAICISLVWMSYFTFLSCSSYPIQVGLKISPFYFGLILSIAAVGYVVGSTLARLLATRIDSDAILCIASLAGALGAILILFATWIAPSKLESTVYPMVLILLAVGMAIPACQAGMLRSDSDNPGVSSGLFFFLEMIAGAGYAGFGNSLHEMSTQKLALLIAAPCLLFPMFLLIEHRARRYQPVFYASGK